MFKFLNQKKFSIFLLMLSGFIFIYTFYKSELVNNGLIRFYYNQYYIFSFLLFISSFLVFFLKKNVQNNLFLVFFSITLTLYLLEFLILNKYFFIKDKEYRDRYQFYNYYKKKDDEIKLTVDPVNYVLKNKDEFFPLSGISNKKTIHCNESGNYSIYESDKYGFNNPSSEWNKTNIDFLLIGDSFTHGACVNRPYDIASQLRKQYNKTSLNLGYSGTGPLIQLATLSEYLPKLKVKNIIWLYFEGNDQTDLIYELKNDILRNYFNDDYSQNLFLKQNEIDKINNNFLKSKIEQERNLRIKKYFKLSKVREIIQPVNFFEGYEIVKQPLPSKEFKKVLIKAKKISKINNANLYFLFLPDFYRYSEVNANDNDYKNNEIVDILDELNIQFIDFHDDIMSKEKDPLSYYPFRSYNHFNREGYKKIANYIYKKTN